MRLPLVFFLLTSAACGRAQIDVSDQEAILLGGALSQGYTIEAEGMAFPAGVGEVFSDTLAGGGQGLLLRTNGTAAAQVTTGALSSIVVRARGSSCKGAPQMVVKLNGREVQSTRVSSDQWSDFSAAITQPAGAQRVEVSFSNDQSSAKCDRNLRVDRIQLVEAATSAPPATSSFEAETLVLSSGGGAIQMDSSASAGSALLIWTNETASGDYTTRGVTSVTVRARGQLCDGAPQMVLRVDGVDRLTRLVESTTWAEYTAAVAIPDGAHRITVAFTNDAVSTLCDRNLFVDRVSLSGDTAAVDPAPQPVPEPVPEPVSGNPFANAAFYVNSDSDAARQAEAWRSSRPEDAAQMDKIAQSADAAAWFGEWNLDITAAVSAYVNRLASAGALPVLVAYNMPRDGYSAGGLSSPEAYRTWIRAFAAGLGGKRAVVILEPDAIALSNTLSAAEVETRMSLLKDAVTVLSQAGGQVYIDAGNSAWRTAADMAKHLIAAGVADARGFSLNVSNYRPTDDEVSYGRSISALIGGKTFIVDTSRNGLGALGVEWCNADGRALGPRPTSATGDALVDAFFWVKRPGESDGTCNGGPAAGEWYPEYALGLAQRASY